MPLNPLDIVMDKRGRLNYCILPSIYDKAGFSFCSHGFQGVIKRKCEVQRNYVLWVNRNVSNPKCLHGCTEAVIISISAFLRYAVLGVGRIRNSAVNDNRNYYFQRLTFPRLQSFFLFSQNARMHLKTKKSGE